MSNPGPRPCAQTASVRSQGAFTEALLEGLGGKADGFGGQRDGVIDSQELGNWVVDRVKELTGGDQHTVYYPSPELPPFPLFALEEP